MNAPPPPIPKPWSRRLSHAREHLVPGLVFIVVWATIALLWQGEVAPTSLIGEVEVVKADIIPQEAGVLTELAVAPFQRVAAGDVIAIIARTDPAELEASVAVIRAELELLGANLDPMLTRQRADLDYERLRVDLMNRRLDQAGDQIRLDQAEVQLRRTRELAAKGIVTNIELEQAELAHALLANELDGRGRLIASAQADLDRLSLPAGVAGSREQSLRAAASIQERRIQELETTLGPLVLRAPIAGRLGLILRRPAETVVGGEIIATITQENSERIVAYLRPPVRAEVLPGQTVTIRTRSGRRVSGLGVVEQVGSHFGVFPIELQEGGVPRPERALTFAVAMPRGFPARPGEVVDISLIPVSHP